MNTRGAGLAALSAALVAMLAACGGAATASELKPTATHSEQAVDVEAVARDEIAAIDALGYPTELATWDFQPGFTGTAGGTAQADYPAASEPTRIHVDTDADDYEQYGPNIEVSVRSTVRHEFGHAIVYSLGYTSSVDAEIALRKMCPDPAVREPENTRWGHECMAEAISELLTVARDGERIEFYGGTDLSRQSIESARRILEDSLTW